jgi:hypothetical protein
VDRRERKVAIVMVGFRCPPDTGPAVKMKRERRMALEAPATNEGTRGPVESSLYSFRG